MKSIFGSKCRRTGLITLISLCLLCIAARAPANLVDWGGSTYDDQSGLEWLDLTATAGLSYNDLGASGSYFDQGWQLASEAAVRDFYISAGIDPDDRWGPTNLQPTLYLMDLVGILYTTPTDMQSWGLINELSGPYVGVAELRVLNPRTSSAVPEIGTWAGSNFRYTQTPRVGAYLVRPADPVPEPGTMILLGSGLAGLAGYGRKRKK